jgi:hypothetical protein
MITNWMNNVRLERLVLGEKSVCVRAVFEKWPPIYELQQMPLVLIKAITIPQKQIPDKYKADTAM